MKLFYRKSGDGPPLIILHGLYGSSDNWVAIARKLSEKYTVYLPDQRNHGNSGHHPSHRYNDLAEDLYELAGDLNLSRFFLAGHSMGGKAAINFAIRWPEMLNGLLIADISPFSNERQREESYNQHFEILDSIINTRISETVSREEIELQFMKRLKSDKITGLVLKNLKRNDDKSFGWKLNAVNLLANLNEITSGLDRDKALEYQVSGFPVIFIKGGNSEYIGKSESGDIHKIFPSAEIFEIKNAGHWLHAEQPDEVVRYIRMLNPD